ncbi:redoxin domain-containing protein [Planctomycetota bacterium]
MRYGSAQSTAKKPCTRSLWRTGWVMGLVILAIVIAANNAHGEAVSGPNEEMATLSTSLQDASLLAWYPLDEGEGEVAYDHSGNSLDAQLSNMIWDANAAPGLAGFSVAGAGQGALTLPIFSQAQIQSGLTLTGWFRIAPVDRPVTLWSLDSGTAGMLTCQAHPEGPGYLSAYVTNPTSPGEFIGNQACPIGEWTHQALSLDPVTGTVTLIQDGMTALIFDFDTQTLNQPLTVRAGSLSADPCGFAGNIDSVQVYSGAMDVDAVSHTRVGHPFGPSNPMPQPGAMVSAVGAQLLEWSSSIPATQQNIRFGTHPDNLSNTTVGLNTVWSTPEAVTGETYFWQIEATGPNEVIPGPLWHYTVAKESLTALMDFKSWFAQSESYWGQPVPNIAGVDLDGKIHRLSDYRGRHIMLMVWSPWCHSCMTEMERLSQLRSRIHEDDLKVLAITPPNFITHAQKLKTDYPDLDVSFITPSTSLPEPFNQIIAYPTHFFLAPDGTLKVTFFGSVTVTDIDRIMNAALP